MSEKRQCPHAGFCADLYHVLNCDGSGWYECPVYDRIEDHMMEARDMARDYPTKDEIPFFDFDEDFDGAEAED